MKPLVKITRRTMLATPALLSFADNSVATVSEELVDVGSETCVAYFTRTGNTAVIARQICRAVGANLFEIRPTEPYPEDYEETVAQSQRERDAGFEPELLETVADMSTYRTVYLGFPIWSQTAPPVIRSFLSAHDLSGKRLVPFVTHGGYGLGNSQSVLAEHAPDALLKESFSIEADQERRTLTQVTRWLAASRR